MKIFNQWFWFRFCEEWKGIFWIITVLFVVLEVTSWAHV